MALPNFTDIAASEKFKALPLEKRQKITGSYWDDYEKENPADRDYAEKQRKLSTDFLALKDEASRAEPLSRRTIEANLDNTKFALLASEAIKLGKVTPEQYETAFAKHEATMADHQRKIDEVKGFVETAQKRESARTGLAQTLQRENLFGSATSAMGNDPDTEIRRTPEGQWDLPFMAPATGNPLVDTISGVAGVAAQKLGSRLDSAGVAVDKEKIRSTFDEFQKTNNLSDEDMAVAWKDLGNMNRKMKPEEKARILSDGTILPNYANSEWLDEAKATKIIDTLPTSDLSKEIAKSRLKDIQREIAGSKIEAYGAAASGTPLQDPVEWARANNRLSDFGTAKFVKDYEEQVASKSGWGQGLVADFYQGNMKLANTLAGFAGFLGSETAGKAGAEMSQASGLVGQGSFDTGMVGSVIEELPSLITQIGLTRGMGATATALGASKGAARAVGTFGALTTAGAQSAGATYSELIGAGKPEKEAREKAAKAGINTALITGLFQGIGAGGIEKFAVGGRAAGDITMREVFKYASKKQLAQNLGRFSGSLALAASGEGLEEGLDELSAAFLNADPDTNLADAWTNALQAAKVGAVIGGTVDLAVKTFSGPTHTQGTDELKRNADAIAKNAAKENLPKIEDEGGTEPTTGAEVVVPREEMTREELQGAVEDRRKELEARSVSQVTLATGENLAPANPLTEKEQQELEVLRGTPEEIAAKYKIKLTEKSPAKGMPTDSLPVDEVSPLKEGEAEAALAKDKGTPAVEVPVAGTPAQTAADRKQRIQSIKTGNTQSAFALATIAKQEGVDLTTMSREEYVAYAKQQGIRLSDQTLREQPSLRSATSMDEILQRRKALGPQTAEDVKADKDFAAFANSVQRLAEGKGTQHNGEVAPGVAVRSGTKNSSSWLFFGIGKGAGTDSNGDTHKSYIGFKNHYQSLTPARFVAFMSALKDAGFNGDVKSMQDLESQRTLSDQIVMHGNSKADADLALQIAESFFGNELSFKDKGIDNKTGGSHSQILANTLSSELDAELTTATTPEAPTSPTPKQDEKQVQETGRPPAVESQPTQPTTESKVEEGAAQRKSESEEKLARAVELANRVTQAEGVAGLEDIARAMVAAMGIETPMEITSQGATETLNQEAQQPSQPAPNASIGFITTPAGVAKAFMELGKTANASSPAHEVLHLARRVLFNRAIPVEQRVGITDAMIDEAEKFSGAKDGVVDPQGWTSDISKGIWDRKAEEKFARAWERYLRDGKFPENSVLQELYQKMAKWLQAIYTVVQGSDIDIQLTPEIKAVFDALAVRAETLAKPEVKTPAQPAARRKLPEFVGGTPRMSRSTSIKNAATDRYLVENGMAPMLAPARQSNEDTWEAAMLRVEADDNAGSNVVDKILVSEGSVNDEVEEGVLLHEMAVRKARVARYRNEVNEAYGNEDAVREAQRKLQTAQSELTNAIIAAKLAGTAWGRIGQFRQRAISEDFSLEAMEARFSAEINNGAPLSADQSRLVKDLQKRIEEAEARTAAVEAEISIKQREVDALLKKLEEESKKTPRKAPERKTITERVKEKSRSARDLLKTMGYGRTGTLEQMAGERAQMPQFMRDSLDTAKAMAAAGKLSKEIRAVTGWFPGKYDGKMRWEISDVGATTRRNELMSKLDVEEDSKWVVGEKLNEAQAQEMTEAVERVQGLPKEQLLAESRRVTEKHRAEKVALRDFYAGEDNPNRKNNRVPLWYILDHPALFETYPDLRYLPVSFSIKDLGDVDNLGGFNSTTGVISLNPLALDTDEKTTSTLLHEIQHVIQGIEGFPKGGNLEVAARSIATSGEAYKKAKAQAEAAESEYQRTKQQTIEANRKQSGVPEQLEAELADLDPKVMAARDASIKAKTNANYLVKNVEAFKVSSKDRFTGYRNIAGEIEARDVQARANMTPDQLAATEPYSSENIAKEDAIVLFQSQPLPPEALQAFADIAAEYILEGKTDSEVEMALAEDFGLEVLVDHIDKILNAAREQLGKASKGSRAKTPTELFNLIEPDKEINNKLVFNMVRGMINEGVPKEKVLKKVLAKLQEKFPDLTYDQLSDIFTGYGTVKFPSSEEDLKAVRELRNIERIQRQIREVQSGNVPKKTGQQRDAATARIRELQKELKEAFKAAKITRRTSKAQLAGALDAIRTRLQNEIEDLDAAIKKNVQLLKKKAGSDADTDPEIVKLRAERVAKRKEYDKHFGVNRKAMTDSQRLKAVIKGLNKRIAEERALAQKGLVERIKNSTKPVTDAEVERLRATLTSLVDARTKARAALYPSISEEQRAMNRAESVSKRLVDYYQKVLAGQKPTAKTKVQFTPSQELAKLITLKEELKAAVKEMRKQQRKTLLKSKEERSRNAAIKALERSVIDLEARLKRGDLSPRTRAAKRTDLPAELVKRQKAAQDALKALRDAKLPTKEERQEQAMIRASETRRKKIEARIAANDYVKAERVPQVMSTKLAAARLAESKAKEEWNRGFFEKQLADRTFGKKTYDTFAEILNFSRTMKTIADVSAVLRQGLVLAISHPVLSLKAIPNMFLAGFSEVQNQRVKDRIEAHPLYGLSQQAKLFIADTGIGNEGSLSKMEEAFRGRWADKIWGVKQVKGFSERTYNAYLNQVRMAAFSNIIEGFTAGKPTVKEAKIVAAFVNRATGRGDLKSCESAAGALAAAFFSPKFVVSRFQILWGVVPTTFNVVTGFQLVPKDVRRAKVAVAKEYARLLVGISAVYSLAALAKAAFGDEDDPAWELDPRSSNFGRIRIGNMSIDPMGGLLQAATFGARMLPTRNNGVWRPYTKTSKGEVISLWRPGFGKQSYVGVIGSFLRTKLSPVPASVINVMQGQDVVGQPVTVRSEAIGSVIPLVAGDIFDIYRENGITGTPLAVAVTFGLGVQTRNKEIELEQYLSTFVGVNPQEYEQKKASDTRSMKLQLNLKPLDLNLKFKP